jgi:hypothetical protein
MTISFPDFSVCGRIGSNERIKKMKKIKEKDLWTSSLPFSMDCEALGDYPRRGIKGQTTGGSLSQVFGGNGNTLVS